MICKRADFKTSSSLSTHLQRTHKIKTNDYTIQYILGCEPKCHICNNVPRYNNFKFLKYCKEHSHIAEAEAGKIGGKIKKSWNKGLTANDNIKIAISAIKRIKKNRSLDQPTFEIFEYVKSLGFNNMIINNNDILINNITIKFVDILHYNLIKNESRNLFKSCEEKNIKLIQIFSDEWREKKDIVKSIIRNALGKNELKIHGRKCEVKRIEQSISKEFLKSSHISGSTRAQVHFGLYNPEYGLVGVVSGRVPIQKKWGKVFEVARMAFLKNTSVVGGASKLLKQLEIYAKENGYEGVLTYADLRFGDGGVYQKSGYELKGETSTNYWYTEGLNRYDRFMYRAKEGKSEAEVALENKVRPVWGAGNKVYLKHYSNI